MNRDHTTSDVEDGLAPHVVVEAAAGRLPRCPYCEGDDVARLYLASVQLDSCECRSCGARWDEDPTSGTFRGRASRASVVIPRDRLP